MLPFFADYPIFLGGCHFLPLSRAFLASSAWRTPARSGADSSRAVGRLGRLRRLGRLGRPRRISPPVRRSRSLRPTAFRRRFLRVISPNLPNLPNLQSVTRTSFARSTPPLPQCLPCPAERVSVSSVVAKNRRRRSPVRGRGGIVHGFDVRVGGHCASADAGDSPRKGGDSLRGVDDENGGGGDRDVIQFLACEKSCGFDETFSVLFRKQGGKVSEQGKGSLR